MAWVILLVAGLFEVGWAVGLKYSKGFTILWPSVGTVAAMALSLLLLGVALKSLPLGTAYTVWTGVGAVGTVVLGIVLLGESADLRRLACIGLIIAGIVGLKLVTPHRPASDSGGLPRAAGISSGEVAAPMEFLDPSPPAKPGILIE